MSEDRQFRLWSAARSWGRCPRAPSSTVVWHNEAVWSVLFAGAQNISLLPQQNGPNLMRERSRWRKGPADPDTPTPTRETF